MLVSNNGFILSTYSSRYGHLGWSAPTEHTAVLCIVNQLIALTAPVLKRCIHFPSVPHSITAELDKAKGALEMEAESASACEAIASSERWAGSAAQAFLQHAVRTFPTADCASTRLDRLTASWHWMVYV